MKITIQEAIKAIKNDFICFCINTGEYYRKSIRKEFIYEYSKDKNFSSIYGTSCEIFSTEHILSVWQIVEPEENPKPCIYCKHKTFIFESHDGDYYIWCSLAQCHYTSPHKPTKSQAAHTHNELYDKLHGNKSC